MLAEYKHDDDLCTMKRTILHNYDELMTQFYDHATYLPILQKTNEYYTTFIFYKTYDIEYWRSEVYVLTISFNSSTFNFSRSALYENKKN